MPFLLPPPDDLQVSFGFEDARQALQTMWPEISIIMLCIYNFLLIVILLNMLITLMGDL